MEEMLDRRCWTQVATPARAESLRKVLARLRPLCELNSWQLGQLVISSRQQDLASQEQIPGWQLRNWYVYLLHGEIVLRGQGLQPQRVQALTARAAAPLIDRPGLSLVASCASRLLKVDRNRFEQLQDSRAMIEVRESSPAESERLIQQMFGGS